MGLLDSVLGAALGQGGGIGQGGQGGQGDLLSAVIGMLANDAPGGGLGGLMAKFQQAGLGDVLNSWISSGQNQPISPDQLEGALGGDLIGQLAGRLGQSQGDLLGQLSQMLPQVVDQLTPQGRVPSGGLGNMSDLLGALLKR